MTNVHRFDGRMRAFWNMICLASLSWMAEQVFVRPKQSWSDLTEFTSKMYSKAINSEYMECTQNVWLDSIVIRALELQ